MKLKILMIIGIIYPMFCMGITEYKPGDKLYNWAKSGLKMRKGPNLESEIAVKIPFGAKVICDGRKSWFEYLNNSEKIKERIKLRQGNSMEIEMEGTWVKVKYERNEGYVFDSYLSRFKPVIENKEINNLFKYFEREVDSLIYLEKKDSLYEFGRDKIVFRNGIYLIQNYSPGGFWFQMNIPDCSKEEAFLIIRHLEKNAIEIRVSENNEIHIGDEMGGYTIESFKNLVIISGEWSC